MTFPPRALQKCRTKLARKKAYFIEGSYVKLQYLAFTTVSSALFCVFAFAMQPKGANGSVCLTYQSLPIYLLLRERNLPPKPQLRDFLYCFLARKFIREQLFSCVAAFCRNMFDIATNMAMKLMLAFSFLCSSSNVQAPIKW